MLFRSRASGAESQTVDSSNDDENDDEKDFLDQVVGVESLEIVRLRSNYPGWWTGYLQENWPTVRVLRE